MFVGTSKDLQNLKIKIREVVLENEYAKLQSEYDYLESRAKQAQVPQKESLSGPSLANASDKPSSKKNRRKGASGVEEKEAGFPLIRSWEVPTPSGENIKISASVNLTAKRVQQWKKQKETALQKLNVDTLLSDPARTENIDWSKVATEMVSYVRREDALCYLYVFSCLLGCKTNTELFRLMSAGRKEPPLIVNLLGITALTLPYLRNVGVLRN